MWGRGDGVVVVVVKCVAFFLDSFRLIGHGHHPFILSHTNTQLHIVRYIAYATCSLSCGQTVGKAVKNDD